MSLIDNPVKSYLDYNNDAMHKKKDAGVDRENMTSEIKVSEHQRQSLHCK